MNFWQRLRLIGSVVVLVLSLLAIAIALLHTPQDDEDAPARTTPPARKTQFGTTGL